MATAQLVPNVSELHPALAGEGLLLEGMASTPTLDRHNDVVRPDAYARSLPRFLATNPVVLWHHKLNLPPIGRVLDAKIIEGKGLWVKAVLPRPEAGTFAAEVWNAARDGLIRALSIGAKWTRKDRGTHREVIDADLYELSLAPVSVGLDTMVDSIRPTEAKALGGEWMSVDEYQRTLASWAAALDRAELAFVLAELHALSRN